MDDPVGAGVVWFVTVLALALAIPVVAAAVVVGLAAVALWRTLRFVCGLALGSPAERELQRTIHERNLAIRDIVAIRNDGERLMRQAVDEGVTQGTAEEWE